jgi:phosphoribosylformylglycinamidine synthase
VAALEANRQVIFRYVTAGGEAAAEGNPNGSVRNIAGICNRARNVVGLMPHPERACELALGSADGLALFESAVRAVTDPTGGRHAASSASSPTAGAIL